MSIPSANGGPIWVGAVSVPVGRWQANWDIREAEITQSDSGGCTLYRSVVQDNMVTVNLCRDDTAFPEAVGLTGGTVIAALYCQHGGTTKADKLVNGMVKTISPDNDNANDVERIQIVIKGGFVTKNVALPV